MLLHLIFAVVPYIHRPARRTLLSLYSSSASPAPKDPAPDLFSCVPRCRLGGTYYYPPLPFFALPFLSPDHHHNKQHHTTQPASQQRRRRPSHSKRSPPAARPRSAQRSLRSEPCDCGPCDCGPLLGRTQRPGCWGWRLFFWSRFHNTLCGRGPPPIWRGARLLTALALLTTIMMMGAHIHTTTQQHAQACQRQTHRIGIYIPLLLAPC